MRKLTQDFFMQDAYTVAQQLIGKYICRDIDGKTQRFLITETECYIGTQDTACHAHKGKTPRTQVMWQEGGICYVYICYGIHHLINFITNEKDMPECALIRGVKGFKGPGNVTKALQIDKTFYGESATQSPRIWLESDDSTTVKFAATKRVGIGYATQEYQDKLWRFTLVE